MEQNPPYQSSTKMVVSLASTSWAYMSLWISTTHVEMTQDGAQKIAMSLQQNIDLASDSTKFDDKEKEDEHQDLLKCAGGKQMDTPTTFTPLVLQLEFIVKKPTPSVPSSRVQFLGINRAT